jgi:transcriptional regulator with XRE-family HTH domain
MEIEKLQRSTVERLRNVRKEHGLTIPQICEMLDKKGCFISEATVKRVFSENHDPTTFRYRDTLAPLADVILDIYDDKSGSEDVAALKAMIHDKNKMIDLLVVKNEEQKADFERQISHLKKQVDRLEANLDFRERMIDRKDGVVSKLLDNIAHKDEIIEKLLRNKIEE